jgi:hypothetical protein
MFEQYHGDFRKRYGTCAGRLMPEGYRLVAAMTSLYTEQENLVDD